MNPQATPVLPAPGRSALAYNLAGIAVLVLLLAVGAAYLIDDLGRERAVPIAHLDDPDPVTQTISGRELDIPRSWFRFGEQIVTGFTSQIDLRLPFANSGLSVDLTLLPRSRARTSASLLDRVYLHQFDDATLGGVPGLIGKPMLSGDGYAAETVWYDAISPNPFTAKCISPVTPDGATKCVRTVYLPSNIAAIYAFDASLLQNWRDFDGEMERWLSHIGAW